MLRAEFIDLIFQSLVVTSLHATHNNFKSEQ